MPRFPERVGHLTTNYDVKTLVDTIKGKIRRYYGCKLSEATKDQLYNAIAMTVRDQIMERWVASREQMEEEKPKRLYYLSIEFLTGRSLYNNLLNLIQTDVYQRAFKELSIDPIIVAEEEPEPGLGNGGLGRLAACFIDSLATLGLPAMGCSIRYEYGLFRQKIVNGHQVELPDSWLEEGNVWEVPVREETREVRFGGRVEEDWSTGQKKMRLVDCKTVLAVPYDMPVVGYGGETVDVLRLWSAVSPKRIDMASFSRGEYTRAVEERELAEVISKMLYPEDHHQEGRELRLRQSYFFSSASVQHAVAEYIREHGANLYDLPDHVVFHINDTHPGLAIAEFMRVLMDDHDIPFEDAVGITRRCFAYTNHTIMAEALERWPEGMLQHWLPRIYQILQELNEMWCKELWEQYAGQWDRIGAMAILAYGQVQMANLCIAMRFSVNGVSKLHAEILKHDVFRDFYRIAPKKFSGITNGVTHRRWMMQCNPGLAALITSTCGDQWIQEPSALAQLLPHRGDPAMQESFLRVKYENKVRLSNWLRERQGLSIDPQSLFDVQAKRLHEYKRQLLNVMHILHLYNRLADDASFEMVPRTFIFGAKAAPGYQRAKLIIRLINAVGDLVAAHPRASKYINVAFLENYCVSAAEVLIPAAEVSEQISTAGKEASGTSNMKFMMNGALTIGTLDGANVEISEQVGLSNIYLFGLHADEVDNLYQFGRYRAGEIYETHPELRKVMEQLIDGTLVPGQNRLFSELYHALLFGDNNSMADPYLVLKDFDSYAEAQLQIDRDYKNRSGWAHKAITNTACSGVFASDRTIAEYNARIWHLPVVKMDSKE